MLGSKRGSNQLVISTLIELGSKTWIKRVSFRPSFRGIIIFDPFYRMLMFFIPYFRKIAIFSKLVRSFCGPIFALAPSICTKRHNTTTWDVTMCGIFLI